MKGLIALLVVAASAAHAAEGPHMRMLSKSGTVSVEPKSGPTLQLADRDDIPAGALIQTSGGGAVLESDGNATLRVSNNAKVAFNSWSDDREKTVAIDVAKGAVDVEVGGGIFRMLSGAKLWVITRGETTRVQRIAGPIVVREGSVLKAGESLVVAESQPELGAWDTMHLAGPSEEGYPSEAGMPQDLRSAPAPKTK